MGWVVFFAAMFFLWSGILYFADYSFFYIGIYGLISDPSVGPAVIAEQGTQPTS